MFVLSAAASGGWLVPNVARAGALDHFAWGTVASPQQAGVPFGVSLTANDSAGRWISNYSATISLSAEILAVPPLVISEVDNGTSPQAEFTNPSTNAVELSGWSVAFYDFPRWPQPTAVFTFPAGTICPPQGVFVIAQNGVAPGSFPNFFLGTSLRWSRTANPVAVLLLNQTNGLVDFFCASTGYPTLITNPAPILPGGWSGAPVALNTIGVNTYQRQGNFNQRQALNWVSAARSIGLLNSNLSLPFTPNALPLAVLPGSVSLTNGAWSGLLAVQGPGRNVLLQADDGNGHPGRSNPFEVLSTPAVRLSLPSSTLSTQPGVQTAALTLPQALGTDLVFTLASSAPAKIGVPPSVLITAGTVSNVFNLTNSDDGLLDGVQLVTVTASNPLFPPAQGTITNYSAPASLTLTLPAQVTQPAGGGTVLGQLALNAPAQTGFQAALASSDRSLLTTPAFVQIPAGQTNASFNCSLPSLPQFFGSRQVTVTAFAGPAATATATLNLTGTTSNQLILVVPSPVVAGSGAVSNAVLRIAGTLLTNLSIALGSSDPGLQLPANLVLPAGQTQVNMPLVVLSNAAAGPDRLATVSAAADGFVGASSSVTMQDSYLDHFALSGIAPAQTVNQPFVLQIKAQNQSGDTLSSYAGSASLAVLGLPAGSVVPAQTGAFTNGQWSGTVAITNLGTQLTLVVQDSSGGAGESNPFDVLPSLVSLLSASVADLVYDPGTDRIYATIPASGGPGSNTVMRLNPYTGSVEAYLPVDTDPGLLALSAANEYLYVAVQGGYSIERLALGTQTTNLEFALPGTTVPFYAINLAGLPNSPASVAVAGLSPYGPSQDYIFDDAVARTNLSDLALVPGLDAGGVLSGNLVYLPNGTALTPTNQQPVGYFPVPTPVSTRPVAPDPGAGIVYFLSQQAGQTVLYTYDIASFSLLGSQVIPNVTGTAGNLVRWGTNGLAFSTSGNQVVLVRSALGPAPTAARLGVSQAGPPLATAGSNVSFTLTITNAGPGSATDAALYDPLPAGASLVSATASQGTVQSTNGILTGSFGTIPPNAVVTLTLTVQPQGPGVLTNTATVMTTALDGNTARETATWATTVLASNAANQVAQLQLPIHDLLFNPADGKLYASVSGTDARFGNSIVAIDPVTLQVSNAIYVGSEPGALALTPDGRQLYVFLQTSDTVELVDLQAGTVSFQPSLYNTPATGLLVLPGSSNSLVLAEGNASVQLLAGGQATQLPNLPALTLIQPSLLPNVFYAYDNQINPYPFCRVQLDGTNTLVTNLAGSVASYQPEMRSGGNLLFFGAGEIVDPESSVLLARIPGLSQTQTHICADTASGRAYYLVWGGSSATITAYALNTYQPVGSLQVTGVVGTPGPLVRWGASGLAFATSGGQLFSLQTPLVPTNAPADLVLTQSTPAATVLMTNMTATITVSNQGPGVATGTVVYDLLPTGMRCLSASCTQGTVTTNGGTLSASLGTLAAGASAQVTLLLRPDGVATAFNYARVAANEPDPVMTNNSSLQSITNSFWQNIPLCIGDLVYDSARGKLFASVTAHGAYSNSIIQVDPATGAVEQFLPTAFEPNKLALSSDSQFLYVGTTTEGLMARVNIAGWTNDLSVPFGNDPNGIPYVVADFAPLPGLPHSVAVSMHTWYGEYTPRLAIYDDATSRPNIMVEAGGGSYFIAAAPDASTLYVINGDSANGYAVNPLTFSPHPITSSGIGPALTNLTGYGSDFRIQNNWLVTQSGQVINLQNNTAVGTFPVTGPVAPDLDSGLVYFLVQGGLPAVPNWTLTACSTNLVNSRWQITVPGATGSAYSLTRCGPDTFAFATQPNYQLSYGLVPTANQLYLLHLSALPAAGDLMLSVTTNWAFAGGNLTNTFTLLNDGPYNATGVWFSNVLASGATLVSATSTQGACTQTNGIVSCAVGSMTAGATVTVTVISSCTNAGPATLQAAVGQNEPELDLSNNQVSLVEMIYPAPAVSVSDLSVYRQSGLSAIFNLFLSAPNTQPVTLYCATTNGTARSQVDYVNTIRTVTFPPGVTNATCPVTILNNNVVEPNLVFYLNVRLAPTSVPLATASCTLLNNNFYSFFATNLTLAAGTSGLTNALFTVRLSGSNYTTATLDYFTRDGTALSGLDYLGKAGTLVFPPGVTNASVAVPVYALSSATPLKTFDLVLANPVNALLGVSQVTASILQSNFIPVLSSSQLLHDGRFQLLVNGGTAGQSYVLLASTNLVAWTPITGFVLTNPPVTLYDPEAAQYPQRFYRVGPVNLAPAPSLEAGAGQAFNSNGFSAQLQALPGLTYEIDGSTDLVHWQPLTNLVSTNSPFWFQDAQATNYPHRFYRAVRR